MSHIEIFEKVNFKLLRRVLAYQANAENDSIPYHDNAQFTLGKIRQLDLLDGDSLPSIPIQRAVHGTESSFTQTVSQLLTSTPKVSICPIHVLRGNRTPYPYIVLKLCNILGRRFQNFVFLRFLFSLCRTRSDSCQSRLYRGSGGSRGGGERARLPFGPFAGPSDHDGSGLG